MNTNLLVHSVNFHGKELFNLILKENNVDDKSNEKGNENPNERDKFLAELNL